MIYARGIRPLSIAAERTGDMQLRTKALPIKKHLSATCSLRSLASLATKLLVHCHFASIAAGGSEDVLTAKAASFPILISFQFLRSLAACVPLLISNKTNNGRSFEAFQELKQCWEIPEDPNSFHRNQQPLSSTMSASEPSRYTDFFIQSIRAGFISVGGFKQFLRWRGKMVSILRHLRFHLLCSVFLSFKQKLNQLSTLDLLQF